MEKKGNVHKKRKKKEMYIKKKVRVEFQLRKK